MKYIVTSHARKRFLERFKLNYDDQTATNIILKVAYESKLFHDHENGQDVRVGDFIHFGKSTPLYLATTKDRQEDNPDLRIIKTILAAEDLEQQEWYICKMYLKDHSPDNPSR